MKHQDRVDHFTHELLKLGKGVADILDDVKAFPKSPELHIVAALFHLYGQTVGDDQEARQHLVEARRYQAELDPQYHSLLECTHKWEIRDNEGALDAFEAHCYLYPHDLLAIKVTEYLFYCNGQKYNAERFLKMSTHCYPLHKDNGYFLAIHSFAHELSGDIGEAEKLAMRGLRLAEDNPWAHHTLSHVYINTGRIEEGIGLLEQFSQLWPSCGRLIESHNFWHLALLYYENLQADKIAEVIRRADWQEKITFVGEEVDASSLLWRMDMQDPSHGLWESVATAIDGHAAFCTIPFVSVQLLYALKRGGCEESLQESLHQTYHYVAALAEGREQAKWKKVGLPLIEGGLAFADGNYSLTKAKWEPILQTIPSCGGSDAQVDLFNITYLNTLLQLNQKTEAKAFLHQLAANRPLTKREEAWIKG